MMKNILIVLKNYGFKKFLIAVYYGLMSVFYKYIIRKKYIKKKIYDYEMLLDVSDPGISRTLILFGERELDHKYLLEKILKKGMTIYDIGANIGYYALMEKKHIGDNGKIIALEPSPSNVELLLKNISLNQVNNVEVIEKAVSDKCGESEIFISNYSNLNTFHPVNNSDKNNEMKKNIVQTTNIGNLVKEYGKPDLIRMDIEGHEVEVLTDLAHACREYSISPIVIFETHLTRYTKEHDFEVPLKNLFELGYEIPLVASSREWGTTKIEALGYKSIKSIKSDHVCRDIFENIKLEDGIDLICHTGGIRTVVLSRKSGN